MMCFSLVRLIKKMLKIEFPFEWSKFCEGVMVSEQETAKRLELWKASLHSSIITNVYFSKKR
jgi:hypothetical protein